MNVSSSVWEEKCGLIEPFLGEEDGVWGKGERNELPCPGKKDISASARKKRGMRRRNKSPCPDKSDMSVGARKKRGMRRENKSSCPGISDTGAEAKKRDMLMSAFKLLS